MKINLVYCHIGNSFPTYFFDCLYQSLIVQQQDISIYVLTNEKFIKDIYDEVNTFNIEKTSCITIIPIELIQSDMISNFKNINLKDNNFRDGFWEHTTSRFIYIYEFMKLFKLENVFHIENDVMIYCDLVSLQKELTHLNLTNKIIAIQDAPNRSICSFMFIPTQRSIFDFLEFSLSELKKNKELNDMNLMGTYSNKNTFPESPIHALSEKLGVFDGACIGQYIGGIDIRNTKIKLLNRYTNPTIGFINETSVFKPNSCSYYINEKGEWSLNNTNKNYKINCLHIHSKQLFNFTSRLPIKYNQIISGDRVLELVDIIFTTDSISNFHKIHNPNILNKLVVVKDFNNISKTRLSQYIQQQSKNGTIKIFCYTHILKAFFEKIFPYIDNDIRIVLYTHNSDDELNKDYLKYMDDPRLHQLFAQNLNIIHPKANLLPIGLANAQWIHGDLNIFYNKCIESYYKKKSGEIYININPNTYNYRRKVLEELDGYFTMSSNKPYDEYVNELTTYRFCLCIRGNGIDTHRFWESLYLGVIPVVVVNEDTNCKLFIENLKKSNIPFHEVASIDEIKETKFNENLYNVYYSKLIENFFVLNLNHYCR